MSAEVKGEGGLQSHDADGSCCSVSGETPEVLVAEQKESVISHGDSQLFLNFKGTLWCRSDRHSNAGLFPVCLLDVIINFIWMYCWATMRVKGLLLVFTLRLRLSSNTRSSCFSVLLEMSDLKLFAY